MKKLYSLFFSLFFVCLLAIVFDVPAAHSDPVLSIKVNNYSNKTISFAFARENGYNTSDTTTRGWFSVPPRKSKTIKPFKYNPNDNYYWYAKGGGQTIASGNDFNGWIISNQAFISQRGRKLGGGSRVGFKVLKQSRGAANINIGKP
ncbi:MAG: DUF1036 domain-containing protein [Desulfovibrio sp.]|nr:DUF1036 domain-containing protein [Desulfovibrio sp.]